MSLKLVDFCSMKLCILGVGSKECRVLEEEILQILQKIGDASEISISDDIDLFLRYQIAKTPALLINDELIHNEDLQNEKYLFKKIKAASLHKEYK